jgi:hypothetical protein
MKNIYYILWVDAIVNANDYKKKQPGWEVSLFWLLTTMNIFNILFIIFWLDYFQIYRHEFIFDFRINSFVLGLLEVFVNVFIPFDIINYFSIFYKKRYRKLIMKYPHYNGKIALYYSLSSIFLIVLTVIFMW